MEAFSALLTLCAGNSLVTDELSSQGPMMFSLTYAWTSQRAPQPWLHIQKKSNTPYLAYRCQVQCLSSLEYTPLWKSNRNFFSTQIFNHLFFVVCSSFYTWYMWGGQYQFCNFLLDFDHWLYFSDILKKVTGSKPNFALIWFMQWAKMELEHGENTSIGV